MLFLSLIGIFGLMSLVKTSSHRAALPSASQGLSVCNVQVTHVVISYNSFICFAFSCNGSFIDFEQSKQGTMMHVSSCSIAGAGG